MKERVLSELKKIEDEENVKIIFACESGSRAWGFPSKDSDYDVRFIYIHPTDWYLSISDKRDVIERPINDALDINGWDIRKALKLLRKSNPPLLEWLQSPIIYLERYSVLERTKELVEAAYSPRSCLYHYYSMAKGNFREYLQGDLVRAKKYFYVLRPVLACKWIVEKNTMPPMEFAILVNTILEEGPLLNEIRDLLQRKMAGEELDCEPKITIINKFLNDEIQHLEHLLNQFDKPLPPEETHFDNVFRRLLQEVWS